MKEKVLLIWQDFFYNKRSDPPYFLQIKNATLLDYIMPHKHSTILRNHFIIVLGRLIIL